MAVTLEQAYRALLPGAADVSVPATPSVARELVERQLRACVEQVERRAPDAPEAVKEEATLRLFVWLERSNLLVYQGKMAITSRALATGFRSCGAASALAPWARRPAVSIG